MVNVSNIPQYHPDEFYIILFGGCGEFGMNMTGYYHQNKLFIVDCGGKVPPERLLGVQTVISDPKQIINSFGGVFAYFITHAHEDHIAGLPYTYKQWPANIFATQFTMELIKEQFRKAFIPYPEESIICLQPGNTTCFDDLSIECVHINHSIPMSVSFLFKSNQFNIFHSGDFRLDQNNGMELKTDLEFLKEIGQNGVDLLVADSTNAEQHENKYDEADVAAELELLISSANGKVFIATFSSNLYRINNILNISSRLGKKVYFANQGMFNSYIRGVDQNIIPTYPDTIVDEQSYLSLPANELVILASGCQGEYRSALFRIAHQTTKKIAVSENDLVILSSRSIPGNERAISNLISLFHKQGVKVITSKDNPKINASGHASRSELSLLIDTLKPKFYLPTHGTFTQLLANIHLAQYQTKHKTQCIFGENGLIYKINDQTPQVITKFELDNFFIDQQSHIPLPYNILRDRLKIGELGLILITGVMSIRKKTVISPIKIELIGLDFDESSIILDQISHKISSALLQLKLNSEYPTHEVNYISKQLTRQLLLPFLRKKPFVLSRIIQIEPE